MATMYQFYEQMRSGNSSSAAPPPPPHPSPHSRPSGVEDKDEDVDHGILDTDDD